MKNFINLRLQYLKASSVNHNYRPADVAVSKSQKINTDGKNYYLDFNTDKIEIIERKNYKQIRKHISKQLENDNNEFSSERNKRRGRTINDKGAVGWVEGILTFSEAINKDLGTKYQIEDLVECAKNTMNEINKKWNTKNVGLMLHMDETTPHLHFFLKNYETEQENSKDYGVSIFAKHKTTKDLSELQDIAFKEFSKLGMERGVKKIFNPARYETVEQHHSKLESEYRQEIFCFEQEEKYIKNIFENASKMSAAQVQEKYNEIIRKKQSYKTQFKGNEDKLVIKTLNGAMRQLGHLAKEKQKIEDANDIDIYSKTFKTQATTTSENIKNISRIDISKDTKIDREIEKLVNSGIGSYKKTYEKYQEYKQNFEKVNTLEIELKEKSLNDSIEISKLKAQIEANNRLYEANLTKINQKLDNTENKLNNTDFYTESKKFEEQNIILIRENQSFQKRIAALEAKEQEQSKILQEQSKILKQNESTIQTQATQIEATKPLQEQINAIKLKYNALSSKYTTLETQNKTLESERNDYKSSSDKYEKEYKETFDEKSVLEKENKRLKDTYEPKKEIKEDEEEEHSFYERQGLGHRMR